MAMTAASLAAFFAATHPERRAALILYGRTRERSWAAGLPAGSTSRSETAPSWTAERESFWGNGRATLVGGSGALAPSVARRRSDRRAGTHDSSAQSASPGPEIAFEQALNDIDVRAMLPAIQAPTARAASHGRLRTFRSRPGEDLAERIAGARFVELPGVDSLSVGTETRIRSSDEVEGFVRARVARPRPIDRVLATVLFTDIVGSTQRAAELGDARMEGTARHTTTQVASDEIDRYRGRYVHTTGDGLLATFDGPARAVRCAEAIVEAVRALGLEIRAGCHTGEVELAGDDIQGIAVHIGARVAALAGPGGRSFPQTVKDLVAGSGLHVRGRRRARAEGRARPLAPVPGGELT